MNWRPRGRRGFYLAAAGLVAVLAGFALWWALSSEDGGGSPSAPEPTAIATSVLPTATVTPVPTARIADCPVDREICDYAVQAEGWVRTADAESLIADRTPWDNANDIARLMESITGALPVVSRPARLTSIGCPMLGGGNGDCSGAFSLTFTTLTSMERAGPDNRRGVLTLGFLRRNGQMPALTSIAVPDGDDRTDATITGGVSSGCSLSGLPPRTETECILAQFLIVTVERPLVAGQPPECPYLPEICQLALKVEQQLKDGDYAGVAGSADVAAKLKADLVAALGKQAARLISVGCPFGDTQTFCDGPFALVLTTLEPGDDWTTGGKMAALRFEGPASAAKFEEVLLLSDADTREAAILGGFATKPCEIAGVPSDGSHGCAAVMFERYWSAEPFAPVAPSIVKLERRPAAAPPANSVLYTASGPCWACDESDNAMRKHVVDAAGKMTTTTILENGKGILDGWLIGYLTASPDGAVLAAMVCDGGYCGDLGEIPEATWRVVWSKDGGATWVEAWRGRTYRAHVSNVSPTGFVVTTVTPNPAGGAFQRYEVVRGTETREVQPPAGLPARPDVALLPDGSVAWIPLSEDGLVVGGLRREDGTRLPIALPAGAQYPRFGLFADGRVWAMWYQNGYVLGVFKANGGVEAIYNAGDLFRPSVVTDKMGIGTVSLTGKDAGVPALADFAARAVTPLGAPFGEAPMPPRSRLLAVQFGR